MATKQENVLNFRSFPNPPAAPAPVAAPAGLERQAALGLTAAGIVLMAGTALDLSVLWVLQSVPSAEWEFMAVSNTVTAFPGLVISAALLMLALHLRWPRAVWAVRLLAVYLLGLGVAGGGLAGLMATDYLAMRASVPAASMPAVWSTMIKSVMLGGLYFVLLVPIGILQLRRARRG